MRNSVYYLFIIVLSFSFLIAWSNDNPANGQCLNIESKVEKSTTSSNSDISLKVNKGNGVIKFYLYDLNAPQKGAIKEVSKSASDLKNEFVTIFKNIPPSNYTIQAIDNNKCQVSIGGVEGILISGN